MAALPPWDGKTREIQGDFNLRLFCLQMVQIFQTGTLRAGPGKRLVIGDTGDFQVHLSFFLREKFPVDAETFFYIILQSKPPLDLSEHPRCQTLPAPRPRASTRYPSKPSGSLSEKPFLACAVFCSTCQLPAPAPSFGLPLDTIQVLWQLISTPPNPLGKSDGYPLTHPSAEKLWLIKLQRAMFFSAYSKALNMICVLIKCLRSQCLNPKTFALCVAR